MYYPEANWFESGDIQNVCDDFDNALALESNKWGTHVGRETGRESAINK